MTGNQHNTSPPAAVIATVCGCRLPLNGTPQAYDASAPDSVTVILGALPDGSPVTLTVTELDVLDKLGEVMLRAWAHGKVKGMPVAVTR